jgi:hypothetical protein
VYLALLSALDTVVQDIERLKTHIQPLVEFGYDVLPTISASKPVVDDLAADEEKNEKARAQIVWDQAATTVTGVVGPQEPIR